MRIPEQEAMPLWRVTQLQKMPLPSDEESDRQLAARLKNRRTDKTEDRI